MSYNYLARVGTITREKLKPSGHESKTLVSTGTES